jgi:hypothetical protein
MPLAQNYKDDVSLLESETALSKATMDIITPELSARRETNTTTNVSVNLHFILNCYQGTDDKRFFLFFMLKKVLN